MCCITVIYKRIWKCFILTNMKRNWYKLPKKKSKIYLKLKIPTLLSVNNWSLEIYLLHIYRTATKHYYVRHHYGYGCWPWKCFFPGSFSQKTRDWIVVTCKRPCSHGSCLFIIQHASDFERLHCTFAHAS